MTEHEARDWIQARFGDAGVAAMERLVAIVTAEAALQNLIAPSTIAAIWARHVVDSAQLLAFAPDDAGVWLDIGSGAGFPGLAIAALTQRPVWLVEPRKRRAEFLTRAAEELGVAARARIVSDRVEAVKIDAAVISARAVAPLHDLFSWAGACASSTTLWILPKGRTAREEVALTQHGWSGVFHVEQSVTDPESMIVLASGVARR